MKSKIVVSVMLAFTCMALFAKHSDDFLMSNYSYWRSYGTFAAAADSTFKRMKDCGYNSTICNTYSNEGEDLKVMLHKMDAIGLDAILTDFAWDAMQSNSKYATRGFTLSNFQRFEAEYYDESSVKPDDQKDDAFFYSSRIEDECDTLRVGEKHPDDRRSNYFIWQCEANKHQAGYAFKNLTYRWKREGSKIYEKLNEEFQFNRLTWDKKLTAYMLDNTYMYFTFAFKIPSYDKNTTKPTNLIRLELCGNTWKNGFKKLPYVTESGETNTDLVMTPHFYEGITRTDKFGNKLYTIQISLRSLQDNGFVSADDAFSGKYVLSDINPRIYWYGTSSLQVDYIEIEDSIHRNLATNYQQVAAKINSRINDLNQLSAGNISHLYSFDEPNHVQFDSYKLVQDAIGDNKPSIFTAIYDWRRNMVKSSNSKSTLDKYYHQQRAFLDKSKPKILAPDLYPIKPDIQWNLTNDANFLQTKLEVEVLVKYQAYKTATKQNPNLSFIPIIQTFGAWDRSGAKHQWVSWLRPPKETQKLLKLLPLCYGADGIIDYQFATWNQSSYSPSDKSSYQYGPLNIIQQGTNYSYVPLSNYYALKEANEKINKYASIVKNSVWLGADSLMIANNNPNIALAPMMLQSLFVVPANDLHYQGYVQCGLYADAAMPYFMLVNRRANYVKPGYNPATTENDLLDNCFDAALPQTVRFIPNEAAHAQFGSHLALYDSYSEQIYNSSGKDQYLDVSIDPGDGKLLKMVGSLPKLVSAAATLDREVIIGGNILLENGINVSMAPNTTIRVKANTHITVPAGASLVFRGKIIFEDGSLISILPSGSVSFDSANCVWGSLGKESIINGSFSNEEDPGHNQYLRLFGEISGIIRNVW